ncbi:haloacid dehalogenase type II [Marinomonas epiphytica]
MTKDIIVFDINETVLDLSSLKDQFVREFRHDAALELWFAKLLHSSTVCVATGVKSDFATLAASMLEVVAAQFSVALTEQGKKHLLQGFASLPAHQDIIPALSKLREQGYRTVALSNSSSDLIQRQLKNAGIVSLFDQVISVEQTGSFKPDPNVYRYAAECLSVTPDQIRLVATHDWDTHGALSVGMKAAYIARTNTQYNSVYLAPDIHASDMLGLVNQILNQATLTKCKQTGVIADLEQLSSIQDIKDESGLTLDEAEQRENERVAEYLENGFKL